MTALQMLAVAVGLASATVAFGLAVLALAMLVVSAVRRMEPGGCSWGVAALAVFWAAVAGACLAVAR